MTLQLGTMHIISGPTTKNSKKPLNKDYEPDIEKSEQYSRWFLEFLGVWPMIAKNTTTAEKCISKFMMVVCFLAMCFPLVPVSLDTFLVQKSAFVRLLRFIGPISACLSTLFKYVFIIYRSEKIALCMEHIESDWMEVGKENEKAIMMKNLKAGRSLTVIACIIMYSSTTFYFAMKPLIIGTKLNERNETVRPEVYPGFDLFFDSKKSPAYEIIFCILCISSCIRYTVTMAAYNLATTFVCHACGQIQVVISRLERLFDEIEGEECNGMLQERISSIIHCHVRGLRLSTDIDDVLQEICFIEVVSSTLLICLSEYMIQSGWENSAILELSTYVFLLCSYIFNVFIFCYIGELLKERYEEVGKSTYLIDWYRLPSKTGLAVIMIIAMANIPRKITAGHMIDLSMATFGTIIRTSAAYLNMMRTMSV